MARSKDEKSVHLSATTPSMSTIAPNREGNQLQDAVIAIATALGNEVAAMVIRHPSLTIEEMLELVCQSVREVAHIAAGSSRSPNTRLRKDRVILANVCA